MKENNMTKFAKVNTPLIAEVTKIVRERYELETSRCSHSVRFDLVDFPNLKLEVRKSGKSAALVRVWAGDIDGQLACSQYADFYADCKNPEDWRAPEEVTKGKYPDSKAFGSANYLASLIFELLAWVEENGVAPKEVGVTFAGTKFERFGERDFMACITGIQMIGLAQPIPSVGSNLGFEFPVHSSGSRIDAVEFNENGEVITVIECQSGIQHGDYLDDEHFSKAICRYPKSEEIVDTVRKIVIIAGGYTSEQLATFKELPYEVVALQTKIENDQIVLQEVSN